MSTTGSIFRVWLKDGRWKLVEAADLAEAERMARRRWRGRVTLVKQVRASR